jgi:hypothetical protein
MSLSRLIAFLRGAWRTLPVETLVVAMAATGAIGLVHDRQVWFLRLFLAGVLLTPLALAAHRLGRCVQLCASGLVTAGVLAALVVGLPDLDAVSAPSFSWPYRLAFLAALLVPFVASGGRFTHFVRRFFEETTTWGLLWLGAVAAAGIVFTALKELFDLPVENLGIDAVIVLTSGFILVYLHRLLDDDAATPGRMPEVWRRLATTIGAPFVSVMLVILVVYELVALARGELPRNMLSPLILAAGFVGFVSTLIISSVLGEGAGGAGLTPAEPHRWARRRSIRLARAFPIVLFVLLPMAGWALWMRVEQYGFTPFRAVRAMGLLCLATLCLVGAVRWLRGRAPLAWEVPAGILVFALAAAFGPTSAVRLSIASQTELLGHRLDEVGAGRTVGAAPRARRIELAWETYEGLRDGLRTLAELGGEPALRGVLSGSVEACTDRWSAEDCLHRIGIYLRDQGVQPSPGSVIEFEAQGRFTTGPGQLAFVDLRRGASDGDAGRTVSDGVLLVRDSVVVFAGGQESGRASLADLIAASRETYALPLQTVPIVGPGGAPVAELAVQHLEAWRADGRPLEVLRLTGAIVWRR